MLARRAAFIAVALWGSHAVAAAVPIVVQPFAGRCFDAQQLAEAVRARLPQSAVSVGTLPRRAHQRVRVQESPDALTVEVSALDAQGRAAGTERRALPSTGACSALLETASLIVARAATPLQWSGPARTRASRAAAAKAPRAVENVPPNARAVENPPPNARAVENPPPNARTPDNAPPNARTPDNAPPNARTPDNAPPNARTLDNAPPNARAVEIAPSPARTLANAPPRGPAAPRIAQSAPPAVAAPRVEPTSAAPPRPGAPPASASLTSRPTAPPRRIRAEILAAARWSFPVDGPPTSPGGELTLGVRWSRLGVAFRAGVDGDWSQSAPSPAGTITVAARRIPLSLALQLDLALRVGAVRLSAGPLAALWTAHSSGLPHPVSTTFAEPGLMVRGSYRVPLGPIVLEAGVDLDVVFLPHHLDVQGAGTIASTPVLQIAPYLGAGVSL